MNANFVNVWQIPMEDVGLLGVDKGAGVKLLMLPPGYSEKVANDYVPLQPGTWGSYALMRVNLRSHSDADVARAVAYGKRVKIYPLSKQKLGSEHNCLHRRSGRTVRLYHSLRRQLLQGLDRIVQIRTVARPRPRR